MVFSSFLKFLNSSNAFSKSGINAGSLLSNLLVSKNDVAAIQAYNDEIDRCTTSQTAWYKTMQNASPVAQKIVASANGGKVAMEGLGGSMAILRVKEIALQAATVALNIALSVGLAFALQAAVAGIDNYIHAQRNAADAAHETAQKSKELTEDMMNEVSSLDELIAKYKELANSDTQDASTRNDISEIQGQITRLVGEQADNLDLVNGKLEEELQLLNNILNNEVSEAAQQAVAAYADALEESKSAIGNSSYLFTDGWAYAGKREEDLEKILKDLGYENNVQVGGFLNNTLFVQDEFDNELNKLETAAEKAEYLRGLITAIEENYPDYSSSPMYAGLVNQVKAYDDIVGRQKEAAQTLLESVALEEQYSGKLNGIIVNSADSYEQYRQTLIDAVSNSDRLKNAFENGDIDINSVTKYVDDYMSTLTEFSDAYNDWNAQFNSDVKDTEIKIPAEFKTSFGGLNTFGDFVDEAKEAYQEYKNIIDDFDNLDVDVNKTIFGNIDLDDRQVLEWTEENLEKYQDALMSWCGDEQSWYDVKKAFNGTISTVFGASAEYDGIEIAFSPMLQTDNGAVLLTQDTVDSYINGLIEKACADDGSWTNEELFKLDSEGLEVDGLKVKNLLADIGDTAIQTSEAMHFLGKDGAIALAFGNIEEVAKNANANVDDLFDSLYRNNQINEWFDNLSDDDKNLVYKIGIESDDTTLWTLTRWNTELDYLRENEETTAASMKKFYAVMNNGEDSGLPKQIETYKNSISSLQDLFNKVDLGQLSESDKIDMVLNFPKLAPYVDDTNALKDAIQDLIYTSNQGINEQIDNAIQALGDNSPAAVEALEALRDVINDLTDNDGFDFNFDDEVAKFDNLFSAMKESVSATGMTTQSMKNVEAMFNSLDGYDPSKLFERTANGIHMNTKELRNLQSEYDKQQSAKIDDHLQSLINEYYELGDSIDGCTDAAELSAKVSRMNELQGQITDVSNLAAQYKGLTSAYNKWVQAQSAGEEGDMYDSMRSSYDDMKKMYEDGLVGTNAFRTYVDLLSNQDLSTASVDEVIAAWQQLGKTIDGTKYTAIDFLADGSDGCLNFLHAVQDLNSDWAKMNTDGSWEINFGVGNDQEIADALGIDVEYVQSLMRKLSDFGFDINLDSAYTSMDKLGQYAEQAQEKLKELQKSGDIELNVDVSDINLNVSTIEEAEVEIQKAQELLDTFKNTDGTVDLTMDGAEEAQTMLISLITKKQELSYPEVLKIDTSGADDNIQNAIGLLTDLQKNFNDLEIQTAIGADTTEAQTNIQNIVTELNGIEDADIRAALNLDDEAFQAAIVSITSTEVNIEAGATLNPDDVTAIQTTLDNIDPKQIELLTNSSEIQKELNSIDSYQIADKKFNVSISNSPMSTLSSINSYKINDKYYTVHVNTVGSSSANGTAHLRGTAFAKGDWGTAPGGASLVGELGQEIVVDPYTGKWFTVGDNGAEFANIPKGAIVFNHLQTKSLLSQGYVDGRGKAMASGTAFSSGTGKITSKGKTKTTGKKKSTTSKSSSKSSSSKSSSKSNSKSSSNNDEETALERFQAWFSRLFDWIEIRLQRETDKISNYIQSAEVQLDHGSYNASASNYSKAISTTANLVGTEQQAYNRYNQQANTVLKQAQSNGLISTNVAQTIAKRIADGTIDISEYSEEVQEVIKDYQEWYDKAYDTKKAISDLHENIQEYVKDLKDVRDAQRDAKIESIETYTSIAKSGFAYSLDLKYSQLNYTNSGLKQQNAAYKSSVDATNGDKRTLANKANSALKGQLKTSDGKKNKVYEKALNNAKEAIKSNRLVSNSDLAIIAKYSRSTYESLFAYNLAQQNLETAKLEYATIYAANSSDIYSNIADAYNNLDNVSNNKIDLYKKQSQNAVSSKDQNSYLDAAAKQYDKILSNDVSEYKKYAANVKSKGNSIQNTSGQGYKFNTLNKNDQKDVWKYINQAKEATKKGVAIGESVIAKLAQYYAKGYVGLAFYQSCIDYNNALQHMIESKEAWEIDKATIAAEKAALGAERLENTKQEYENQQRTNQSKTDLITAKQQTKTTQGLSLTKSDYNDLIKQNTTDMSIYQNEVAALNKTINENLSKKYWTKNSQEYKDAIAEVAALNVKIQDCKTSQEEYNNAIVQLPFNTLEEALNLLDSIASYNKSKSDLKSAQGLDLTASDYLNQITDNNNKIAKKQKERTEAYNNYLKAMANSQKVYGGKTADQWKEQYLGYDTDINNLKADNEALKDSLRDDVYWRTYERAHQAAKRLQDTLSGLVDLIQESQYYTEEGGFTALGRSQIANFVKSLETARTEVKNYSNDIANLEKLYKNGSYTTEEYKEKLAELQNGLLDSASSMQSYINNIIDMYKNQSQAELDAVYKLIDARNDALQKKKEYYDYDKTIKGKTKDIQSLQAQIAALEGVETAEAKAQKARLQAELAEQQNDLNDTVNDHLLELSQSALDNLKEALQDSFDKYWDNLWNNLDDVKSLVDRATKASTASAATITTAMNKLLKFYGIDPVKTKVDAAYASGTKKVPRDMTALTNENGDEIIVTKQGLLTPLSRGDGVIPAELTQRLYDMAKNYNPYVMQVPTIKVPDFKVGSTGQTIIEQNYESLIHIDGSADAATVSDLKNLGKDLVKKSYEYTQKQLSKNMQLAGYKKKY